MASQTMGLFKRSGVHMVKQMEIIRQRAYELWQAEGRPDGRALEHWCRAEREAARSRTAIVKTAALAAAAAKPKTLVGET